MLENNSAVRQMKHLRTFCYGKIIISRVVIETLLHHATKCFLLYLPFLSSVLINAPPDVPSLDIRRHVPICRYSWFASIFNMKSSNAQLCIFMLSVLYSVFTRCSYLYCSCSAVLFIVILFRLTLLFCLGKRKL